MRVALASLLATGLLLTSTLVTASGQAPAKVGRALATVYTSFGDPQGEIFNDEPGTTKDETLSAFEAEGVRIASGTATAQVNEDASAVATVLAADVDLLDGRVRAASVKRIARLSSDGTTRWSGRVTGLEIDGQAFGTIDGPDSIPLGGGGRVYLNRGNTGLRLVMADADNPLDMNVAVARASQKDAPTPTPTPTTTAAPTQTAAPTATSTPDAGPSKAERRAARAKARRAAVRAARKRLRQGRWEFPIYADARVADSYGADRPPPVGTHKGVDIFARFGSPVVAVHDGTLSSVGTLDISGNRLWLTTPEGDAFFYAHMSSFAPDAVEGAEVEAGTVLGYVGNTGDAEPTPPHVHFEIHPGGEKERPIDPYPVVKRWQEEGGGPPPTSAERPGALVTVRDFLAE